MPPGGGFSSRTARDLDASPAARAYAAILATLHGLTGLAWFQYKNVAALLTAPDAVCWPLVPCAALRAPLTPWLVRRMVAIYIGLGLGAAVLFLARRPRPALAVFTAATALGTVVYALDYRMRFNQTYMFAWVVVLFLATARRIASVQTLLVCFYVWAGTLKLNREWLSGAALYAKPLFVPESLVPAACVYVVVLELGLSWLLFHPRPWVRRAVLAQLALFHVTSFPVVGWFYPVLMFGLLSLFVLAERTGEIVTWEDVRGAARRTVLGTTALFSVFQIVPWFFPGDAALTGEGRLFALHMFDARISCTGNATVLASRAKRTIALIVPEADTRTQCDPIVVLARTEHLCAMPWAQAEGVRIDVAVDAKRTTDAEARPLVRIEDACRTRPSYSVVRSNPWIVGR